MYLCVYIYIYIYIYIVFFGPVKLELGVIPSGQEIIPGKELNVTIIQSNKFFKKNNKTGHIRL